MKNYNNNSNDFMVIQVNTNYYKKKKRNLQ